MNRKKLIEALTMVNKGTAMIIEALEDDKCVCKEDAVAPVKENKGVDINEPVEEVAENTASDESFDEEALNKMKYNEFKKYASSLGVDCKGTRAEIMDRVRAHFNGGADDTDNSVDKVAEVPAKSDTNKSGKKFSKAKATEPTKDEFDEQAETTAKDTDVADIIEALADVDVKATKKNAVEKLAYALREGLIEVDVEDDEEEDTAPADTTDEVEDTEDLTAGTYTAEYDPNGYNDPASMTDERKKAVEEKMAEILESIEDESLTEDDITSYITDNATEGEIDLLGEDYEDEDLIRFYMELVKRTIDNDGDEHEPSDPYELGEYDMCCGHELKYVKKTKKYVCSQCGAEYEAE